MKTNFSGFRVLTLIGFLVAGLGLLRAQVGDAPPPPLPIEELRVMSFNLWVGGESGGQPLSQTMKVIATAKADVAGLQETRGEVRDGHAPDRGKELATMLGWHYFDQGMGRGLLTRFPIVKTTPGKWGALLKLASGREVWLFNVHLAHAPYQPYQLLKIPYANAPFVSTEAEMVLESRKARGHQVESMLLDARQALDSGKPIFLTGDFNEPSHRDWTMRAKNAGRCPLDVAYPSTMAVERAGFQDAYRVVWPNEVERGGVTWTPTTRPDDPKDRHDRIDFVFFAGPGVTARRCEVVGEDRKTSDLVVTPYPSDHRAVVATMMLKDGR